MPYDKPGFVLTGKFVKSRRGEFTDFDRGLIKALRVPRDHPFYSGEWGWTDETLPYSPQILHDLQREDYTVQNKGCSVCSHTYAYIGQKWSLATTVKIPGRQGQITGKMQVLPLSLLSRGWCDRVNIQHQRLYLPNGLFLCRQEFHLLRQYVLNIPRKVIARDQHVSVKAIEKQLSKLKAKLFPCEVPETSLQSALVRNGLMSFITADVDWFSPTFQRKTFLGRENPTAFT